MRQYLGSQGSTLEAIRGKQYDITLSFDGIDYEKMADVNYTDESDDYYEMRHWHLDIPEPTGDPEEVRVSIANIGGTVTYNTGLLLDDSWSEHCNVVCHAADEGRAVETSYTRIGANVYNPVDKNANLEDAKVYSRTRANYGQTWFDVGEEYADLWDTSDYDLESSGTSHSVSGTSITFTYRDVYSRYGYKGIFDLYTIGDLIYHHPLKKIVVECGAETDRDEFWYYQGAKCAYTGENETTWQTWSYDGYVDFDAGGKWAIANDAYDNACLHQGEYWRWGDINPIEEDYYLTQESEYVSDGLDSRTSPLPAEYDAMANMYAAKDQNNSTGLSDHWRIPSDDDWKALYDATKRELMWIRDIEEGTDIRCTKFVSTADPDVYIIVPHIGYYYYEKGGLQYTDDDHNAAVFYWTNTYETAWSTTYKKAYSYKIYTEGTDDDYCKRMESPRWLGMPIRAVYK